jgi:excisionase family DNA binding protein
VELLDEWLTINDAIEMLGISRATIYRWSKSGRLPIYTKLGKSRVKKEDVQRLLNNEFVPIHQK